MTTATESLAEALRLADQVAACSSEQNVRAFQAAAGELVYLHGPALLAALRLREMCDGLVREWRAEADGTRGVRQEHDAGSAYDDALDRCADDLARVLSATGGEAGSA